MMTSGQFKSEMIRILPQLQRFAVSLTWSRPEADDLLQDACTTALQRWRTYDPALQLDRWLFAIVRNCWVSELRKREGQMGAGRLPAAHAAAQQASSSVAEMPATRHTYRTIPGLENDLALPLLLVCAEGYSYREVSQMLNIPVGTVKRRIHRARKSLSALGAK